MTPAIPLAIVLTGILAAGFHLIWGRRLRELFIYWAAALASFGLAQWLVGDLALPFFTVGTLTLIPDMLGALAGILVANALKL